MVKIDYDWSEEVKLLDRRKTLKLNYSRFQYSTQVEFKIDYDILWMSQTRLVLKVSHCQFHAPTNADHHYSSFKANRVHNERIRSENGSLILMIDHIWLGEKIRTLFIRILAYCYILSFFIFTYFIKITYISMS